MQQAKKQLQSLSNDLKKLSAKVEKLIAQIDAPATTRPETRPAESRPKPAAQSSKTTAVDTVFGIIKRSRKGVDIKTLKQKTGFEDKKLHNIIYKLKKQNKIQTQRKGIYSKATP